MRKALALLVAVMALGAFCVGCPGEDDSKEADYRRDPTPTVDEIEAGKAAQAEIDALAAETDPDAE